VSHSPLVERSEDRTSGGVSDAYTAGWAAVNRLARSGDSWSGHERNVAFWNLGSPSGLAVAGGPQFLDVAGVLGLDHADDGRAAARIDLDFDGDEDLVVTARSAPRVRFLVNRLADRAQFVSLRLVGTRANRDALGAVVRVTPWSGESALPDGLVQHRTRRAGEGYLAQSSATMRFGVGPDVRRARVAVRWPRGGRAAESSAHGGAETSAEASGAPEFEDFGVLDVGRTFTLVEGRGAAVERSEPSAVVLPDGALAGLAGATGGGHGATGEGPTGARRIVLARPFAIPSLAAVSQTGRAARLFGATPAGPRGTGRALLVLVWGSWCPPCIAELAAFEAEREALAVKGLDLLALGADGEEDHPMAETALAAAGWRGAAFRASDEALEILDTVLEQVRDRPTRMPLPTAFLFAPDGALAVVYVGGTDPATARADLRLVAGPVEQRADFATPFRGVWRTRPDHPVDARRPAPEALGARLAARGLAAAVRELELARATVERTDRRATLLAFARARLQQGQPDSLALALGHYDELLQDDPGDFDALAGRALVLSSLGRDSEALAAWRAAVAARPASSEARFSLGLALYSSGSEAEARREVETLRAAGATGDPRAAEFAARLETLLDSSQGPGRDAP